MCSKNKQFKKDKIMKKQAYLKPEIQVVELEMEGSLLVNSNVSDTPGIIVNEEESINEGYLDARKHYSIW